MSKKVTKFRMLGNMILCTHCHFRNSRDRCRICRLPSLRTGTIGALDIPSYFISIGLGLQGNNIVGTSRVSWFHGCGVKGCPYICWCRGWDRGSIRAPGTRGSPNREGMSFLCFLEAFTVRSTVDGDITSAQKGIKGKKKAIT